LSVTAQKQKEVLAEDSESHAKVGAGWNGRRHRVAFQNEENCAYDAEMSDGDHRDAGTSQFDFAWPSESVVNFS